jgi:centriolar protein POC1
VAFAPDSSSLITASDDKTVKVWNLPSRRFACSLQGHSNWVRKAVFSPCNAALAASGSDDRLVKLWDVPSHQCIHTFYDHTE